MSEGYVSPHDEDGAAGVAGELYELTCEYLKLVHRLDALAPEERRCVSEIERTVYALYEAMDEQERAHHELAFKVYGTLVFKYRIWPDILKNRH